jgi:hypothetical protein
MADAEVQTDTEILEYIAYLQDALKQGQVALNEMQEIIVQLNDRIDELEKERLDYRYKWMTACHYSSTLIKEGAEPSGGVSQVRDWESSSPYHRYYRMCPFSF